MKVALVKNHCSLRRGGSERYCANLARGLVARGHRVTVIGRSMDAQLREELGFEPVDVPRGPSWRQNRMFAQRCGAAADRGDYDVVYGLGRSLGLDAVRVTERLQAHWVRVNYPGLLGRWQRWNPRHTALIDLERTIYNDPRVRRVIVQSSLDARLLVELYGVSPDKQQLIPNGVDLTVFNETAVEHRRSLRLELGVGEADLLLVFASMDFAGKGLASVLEAMAMRRDGLRTEGSWRLAVLGNGPQARFQRMARQLGIGQAVWFGGRRPDVMRFYGAGDLFVLPTVYEPFPNVNLEAMACGLPVATTSTAGGVDLVEPGRTGYLIDDPSDAVGLSACLRRFESLSLAARLAMSEACFEVASGRSFEATVAATERMLSAVCGESRQPATRRAS
ncbi:MAG: glycosyltransferase family 4 protein [Planctomycetaceae bacterium]